MIELILESEYHLTDASVDMNGNLVLCINSTDCVSDDSIRELKASISTYMADLRPNHSITNDELSTSMTLVSELLFRQAVLSGLSA